MRCPVCSRSAQAAASIGVSPISFAAAACPTRPFEEGAAPIRPAAEGWEEASAESAATVACLSYPGGGSWQ